MIRRAIVTVVATVLLVGPLAAIASGGPIPTSQCEIQRLLGYENVKECEDPDQ